MIITPTVPRRSRLVVVGVDGVVEIVIGAIFITMIHGSHTQIQELRRIKTNREIGTMILPPLVQELMGTVTRPVLWLHLAHDRTTKIVQEIHILLVRRVRRVSFEVTREALTLLVLPVVTIRMRIVIFLNLVRVFVNGHITVHKVEISAESHEGAEVEVGAHTLGKTTFEVAEKSRRGVHMDKIFQGVSMMGRGASREARTEAVEFPILPTTRVIMVRMEDCHHPVTIPLIISIRDPMKKSTLRNGQALVNRQYLLTSNPLQQSQPALMISS